jgi:hypothetical protein
MQTTHLAPQVPRPIDVGPEMSALAPFFPDVTWTGRIMPGGMGPASPSMTAEGTGRHRRIQDGRWIVGDYRQDQFLDDGTPVLTWELHWVVGWDPAHREYRATMADNYGHADVMHGRVAGDRLVFETLYPSPAHLRLIWDASNPDAIVWSNEASPDGVHWRLIESYCMTSVPVEAPAGG